MADSSVADVDTRWLGDVAVGDRGILASELAQLDEQGFVIVTSVLTGREVAELVRAFDLAMRDDKKSDETELGTRRSRAEHADSAFGICWRHQVVLEASAHILGENFQAGGVDLRDPKPSGGMQRLHPDHGATPVPGITATWFLDAFTRENGGTRLLPGSHRSPPKAAEVPIPGTEIPGPGEVIAVGPAGSVLLRDARLFHAGGVNRSQGHRRAALAFLQHNLETPEPDPTQS